MAALNTMGTFAIQQVRALGVQTTEETDALTLQSASSSTTAALVVQTTHVDAGIDINAGLGGIHADTTGSLALASTSAAADAVLVQATDAAGGVQVTAGSAGVQISAPTGDVTITGDSIALVGTTTIDGLVTTDVRTSALVVEDNIGVLNAAPLKTTVLAAADSGLAAARFPGTVVAGTPTYSGFAASNATSAVGLDTLATLQVALPLPSIPLVSSGYALPSTVAEVGPTPTALVLGSNPQHIRDILTAFPFNDNVYDSIRNKPQDYFVGYTVAFRTLDNAAMGSFFNGWIEVTGSDPTAVDAEPVTRHLGGTRSAGLDMTDFAAFVSYTLYGSPAEEFNKLDLYAPGVYDPVARNAFPPILQGTKNFAWMLGNFSATHVQIENFSWRMTQSGQSPPGGTWVQDELVGYVFIYLELAWTNGGANQEYVLRSGVITSNVEFAGIHTNPGASKLDFTMGPGGPYGTGSFILPDPRDIHQFDFPIYGMGFYPQGQPPGTMQVNSTVLCHGGAFEGAWAVVTEAVETSGGATLTLGGHSAGADLTAFATSPPTTVDLFAPQYALNMWSEAPVRASAASLVSGGAQVVALTTGVPGATPALTAYADQHCDALVVSAGTALKDTANEALLYFGQATTDAGQWRFSHTADNQLLVQRYDGAGTWETKTAWQ
jgi:hypothetical protein